MSLGTFCVFVWHLLLLGDKTTHRYLLLATCFSLQTRLKAEDSYKNMQIPVVVIRLMSQKNTQISVVVIRLKSPDKNTCLSVIDIRLKSRDKNTRIPVVIIRLKF